uniref:SCP domain-containing protein n=1 Tax=Panagrellus redivivus TaxID=6233 RepID=A0A7E4VP75_PANRE
MAGLPGAIAVIVIVLVGTVADSAYVCATPEKDEYVRNVKVPEKCNKTLETGSLMSDEYRQSIVDAINLYRSLIANQCDKFESGKPKSANFRKIRYNCTLEQEVKFSQCPHWDDTWTTSGKIYRRRDTHKNSSIFFRLGPYLEQLSIDDKNQELVSSHAQLIDVFRYYLDENAVEIGCFMKLCGQDHVQCTTGHEVPSSGPLYTAGNRCQSNNDCKDAQHPICDMEYGLCDKEGRDFSHLHITNDIIENNVNTMRNDTPSITETTISSKAITCHPVFYSFFTLVAFVVGMQLM